MSERVGGSVAADAEEIVWSSRAGAHLAALRKQAGLSRANLASRVGVSEETIRLWEKGSVQPSADRLARLIALMSLESDGWSALSEDTGAPDLPPLAQRLRRERDLRGITQAEAVRLVGVPQATYAGWETGRTAPGPNVLPVLATFLGIAERDVATLCSSPFVVDTTGWPPFGQFVGARRQELRMTRADLADRLGVSVRSVASWELGYRMPASALLVRLADTIDVDTASLAAALPRQRVANALGNLMLTRQRELGLRAADVARLAGTTEATVSRWANGRSRPAPKNLRRLAEVLKVPYDSIIEATGGVA